MKNILKFTFIAILFFSCKKEDITRTEDFRLDLATVQANGKDLVLDNNTILTPISGNPLTYPANTRIQLQYSIVSKTTTSVSISILALSKITTSKIVTLENNLPDDPIDSEGIWLTGDWLNMRLLFNFHSTTHSIGMYKASTPTNDTLYLELRHSKNNDAMGYIAKTIASYNLRPYAKSTKVPVKLRIKTTHEGVKYYLFDY